MRNGYTMSSGTNASRPVSGSSTRSSVIAFHPSPNRNDEPANEGAAPGTEGSTELPLRPNQHSSPAPSRAQTQPSRSQVLTREDIANRINNLLIKQLSGWHGWYVAMLARSYATRVFGRVRRGHFGACGLPFLSKISMVVGQEGHMKYMALAITSCSPVEILLKGHLRDTEGQDPLVDDASMDALRDGFSDAAVLELNRINAT